MARFSFRRLAPLASHGACGRLALRPWGVPIALDLDREYAAHGPGWFDSSWDLECGLEVHEGLPVDAKLHEWLIDALVRPGLAGTGESPVAF